jgi:HEAT repeat protein
VLAKSAQILGDLDVPQADDALIKLLGYKDPDQRLEIETRMQAADALARMRSKAAVKSIGDLLSIDDSNIRGAYCRALTFIGDRGAIPLLAKSAKSGSAVARQVAFKAIAQLGGAGDMKTYEDLLKGEEPMVKAECKAKEVAEGECAEFLKNDLQALNAYKTVLNTKCDAGDVACWSGLLSEKDPLVRQKAALALGRTGKAEAVAPLVGVVQKPLEGASDDELMESDNARFNAIMGLHWLFDGGVKPSNAAELATKLDKQVDEEKKKTATMRSAEDVKRLAVKLHHLSST